MERKVRFIYSDYSDGYTNMAIDEAVMRFLQEKRALPILRIYKWKPPTISIGYFQKYTDINFNRCQEDGIMVVRRLTGGRAVLHDNELTYSILFTENDFTPFKKREIFQYIAEALTASLREVGVEANIAEKSRGDLKSANCFASPAQYEIETSEKQKLIGSAQVIKNNVMLQHGAIPITTSYSRIDKYLNKDSGSIKNSSAISKVSGKNISDTNLLEALRKGLSNYFPIFNSKLSNDEMSLAEELVETKYSRDEWNKMR